MVALAMLDGVARLDHTNPCHDDYGNPIRSVSHVECYCDSCDSPHMDSDVRPCCWTGVRDVLVLLLLVVNIRLLMMMMMMMMRMVVPPRP